MSNDAFVLLQPQPFAIPSAYGLPGPMGPAGAGGVFASVKDFGAACDATASDWTNPATVTGTDDTAAVQAAIDAAAAAGGGRIWVPAHTKCASAINLDSKFNIRLFGPAGNGAGYHDPPPAQLIYTGTGSSPFISAAHTNGIAIENLGIRYTSSSFSGDLIALTNTTGGADAAYGLIERCLIGGIGVHSSRSCVSLEGAILCSVVDNHLQWGTCGIRGAKTGGLYSNAHYVARNTFDNLTTGAIMNPAQGWTIISNWFEGTDGGSGGMPYAITSDLPAVGFGCGSLAFIGNWLGDATSVSDAWINFGNMPVSGLQMAGNYFSTLNPATIAAVKFPSIVQGASITGNYFSSYIDLASIAHYGVTITGNFYTNEIANIASSTNDLWVMGNKKDSGFAKTIIRVANPDTIELGNHDGTGVFAALKGLSEVDVNGQKVVGTRGSAVTAPTGGTTIDSQARTAINDLITRLQTHGLIS